MGCGCNQTTTCNSCNQTSCGCSQNTTTCTDCCTNTCACVDQPCGCEVELDASCIRYTGEELPCAGIEKGDTIETALQSIAEKLCVFSGSYVIVTSEPAGVNCTNGGVQIDVYDSESDALLSTSYVCIPSTNYINVLVEAPGVNCANGGVTVNIYNAFDDALESTEYICTPTCECPPPVAKENFYEQIEITTDLVSDPSFVNLAYFTPSTYNTLTYTNTSGAAKDYIVSVSYDTNTPTLSPNTPNLKNWVDGAIIKTVAAVDSIQYESLSTTALSVYLFDGATAGDAVTIATLAPDQVLTTAGNPVEVRFLNGSLPKNTAFFNKVTLNNNETVSLKFKSKSGEIGTLLRAQIFVNEIG